MPSRPRAASSPASSHSDPPRFGCRRPDWSRLFPAGRRRSRLFQEQRRHRPPSPSVPEPRGPREGGKV
eukprot:scaffold29141_cov144-Isochrysis_galbana.AAC.3